MGAKQLGTFGFFGCKFKKTLQFFWKNSSNFQNQKIGKKKKKREREREKKKPLLSNKKKNKHKLQIFYNWEFKYLFTFEENFHKYYFLLLFIVFTPIYVEFFRSIVYILFYF